MEEVVSEDKDEDENLQPADTPEYIAEKILQGIKKGQAEVFAHEWMKKNFS